MGHLEEKYKKLKEIIKNMDSVLVAFSGGVDSSLLLKASVEALPKEKVLAITAASELKPKWEQDEAKNIANVIGARFLPVHLRQLDNPDVRKNPENRCYICRKALLVEMQKLAKEKGLKHIVLGDNADDLHDTRPGYRASQEMGIRSPLAEAGLTKNEIRELSQRLGLPTWNKKPFPCLATRFPFGEEITQDKARNIDKAECFMRKLGIADIRVRHHGTVARIEVDSGDFQNVLDNRQKIHEKLKSLGYTYVSLDILGFRSGSMNEAIAKSGRRFVHQRLGEYFSNEQGSSKNLIRK